MIFIVLTGTAYAIEFKQMIIYRSYESWNKREQQEKQKKYYQYLKGSQMMAEVTKWRKSKQLNKLNQDQEYSQLQFRSNRNVYSSIDKNKLQQLKLWYKVLYFISNKQVIYYVVYIIISAIGFKYRLVYCILLIDVVWQYPSIEDILDSVKLNIAALLQMALFLSIIIYMFSVASFAYFYEYYVDNNDNLGYRTYCRDLWECFYSTVTAGLRAGGGIGEGIQPATQNEGDFAGRYVYDLAFFIVVNIVLLNVVFGIIIDSFAQLREDRNTRNEQLKSQCFVCGEKNTDFDLYGNGFAHHYSFEHNIHSYLAFIIYIKNKDENECNGLEKYVKEKIEVNDHSFMPNTALHLNKPEQYKNEEEEEELNI